MSINGEPKTTNKVGRTRWLLVFYDFLIYFCLSLFILFYNGRQEISVGGALIQMVLGFTLVTVSRFAFGVYRQVWRYGGIQSYMKMLVSDVIALVAYYFIEMALPIEHIPCVRCIAIVAMNLLCTLAVRMIYRYIFKCCNRDTKWDRFLFRFVKILGATDISTDKDLNGKTIGLAIAGAGRLGVSLAEELNGSIKSPYIPKMFIDTSGDKAGRDIHGIPVYFPAEVTKQLLDANDVTEVVVAIPQLSTEDKKRIYEHYRDMGCSVKIYDYPVMEEAGERRIREFNVEDLLFRKQINIDSDLAKKYYKDKVILITGGGGSIGSELCRQLAKMAPKQLVILDIYENGAYDVQQELHIAYGDSLKVCVEIASICDKDALERVFDEYHPQIVVMAAAHKHVPLMEKNCIEAVKNNVFGTLNTVELSEKYNAERVIMVSTDKAVNPTNVMGATKRMCEMIVQAHAAKSKEDGNASRTTFSMTRFGNVLGSAGSVIPLFKKQIANGGPITLTDKRIVRYFMTIPEASQLVLQSGAMAKNGELFVLDMGQPIKIFDLAENMIRISGAYNVEIVETGLRPGEKLYEELLIKSENLDKTDNELIFIERDNPLSMEEISQKLKELSEACTGGNDEKVKTALHSAVPTYTSSFPAKVKD